MKTKYRIVILFLMIYHFALSQAYNPLPYENAVWREYQVDDPVNSPDIFAINEYYFSGDSIIDDTVYTRIRYYILKKNGDTAHSNNVFLYRQDTITKKVYIRNIYYPFNDTLIYDFSVEEGDTLADMLFFPPGNSTDYFIWVDKIDSIETPIGILKRYWLLSTALPWGYGYWIEGIGNINGFFYQPLHLPLDLYYEIICFKKDGMQIYETGIPQADCDSIYASINFPVNPDEQLVVFPNPVVVNEKITIQLKQQPRTTNLTLMDINGRIIFSDKIAAGKDKAYLSIEEPGFYLISIQSEYEIPIIIEVIVTP